MLDPVLYFVLIPMMNSQVRNCVHHNLEALTCVLCTWAGLKCVLLRVHHNLEALTCVLCTRAALKCVLLLALNCVRLKMWQASQVARFSQGLWTTLTSLRICGRH